MHPLDIVCFTVQCGLLDIQVGQRYFSYVAGYNPYFIYNLQWNITRNVYYSLCYISNESNANFYLDVLHHSYNPRSPAETTKNRKGYSCLIIPQSVWICGIGLCSFASFLFQIVKPRPNLNIPANLPINLTVNISPPSLPATIPNPHYSYVS